MMRLPSSHARAIGLVAVGLVLGTQVYACSPSRHGVDDGGLDDAGGPIARLTIESAPSLALVYGQDAPLEVRYTEDDVPLAGIEVRFALEGTAHDATVEDLALTTDGDGRARTTVAAGSVAAVFRVRVSAGRASPAYVDVSIGNQGFGALRVTAVYRGVRTPAARRTIAIYANLSCDEALPPFPDRVTTLDDETITQVRAGALPAGLTYAIIGRVEGPTGVVLASACTDGASVSADGETPVELTFEDETLRLDTLYELAVRVEPPAPIVALVESARADAQTLIDGTGEAGLYVDGVEDELRARGQTAAANALEADRANAESSLGAALSGATLGPQVALDRFVDALSERLSAIRIVGLASVADATGEMPDAAWVIDRIEVGSDVPPPLAIDSTALGWDPMPTLELARDGDLIEMELELELPLGGLVSATIDAGEANLESAGRLLFDGAGCDVLASWVSAEASVSGSCDRDCALDSCGRALARLASAIQDADDTLDDARDHASVAGEIVLRDEDGDLRVERLDGADLPMTWTSASDPVGDAMTADLFGTLEDR